MKNYLKFKNTEGEEYEFIFRKPDKRRWGDSCDGVCFYPVIGKHPTIILINPHRSNQVILNTVIHETTHAYFPDLTEKEVTAFGNTLSRILYNDLKYRFDEDA
jgi:secreted PhoX family phosphatase